MNVDQPHQNPPPEESPPPLVQPSGSDALWLVITLTNIALLLSLLPGDQLKRLEGDKTGLFIKIAPIVLGLFASGYLWIKQRLPAFLRHTSYKIFQTALLAVLLTLNVTQLPIFPIYPKLKPSNAKLKVGVEDKIIEDGRLFLTIKNHIVTVFPPEGNTENLFEATYKVGWRDVLTGYFNKNKLQWSPLHQLTIAPFGPNFEMEIRKTDGDFDAYFHNRPWTPTLEGTSLEGRAGAPSVLDYRNSGGGGGFIRLPPGRYELTGRKPSCPHPEKQDLLLEAGRSDKVILRFLCVQT